MRLFRHLFQILIWGAVFFLMLKMRLFEIPYIQPVLIGLIFLLIMVWGYLFGKYYFYKKKHLIWLMMLGMFLVVHPVQAQFCSWAESYDQQTFNARQKNWKGDKACNKTQREKAREALDKLRKSPSVFVPSDKLTAAEQKKWRSFRQDSHWVKWIAQNFSDSGINAEEMGCASIFASLCSEYERRHPDTQAKTVGQIMRADEENSGCWPCKMAYITLTVVQSMSADLEKNMCEAGLNILKILMLLWILYAAFLAVIFPSKGATFLKDLLTRVLCMMIAAMILSSGDNLKSLYSSVLSPIVSLGLGLSDDISNNIDESMFTFATEVRSGVGLGSTGTDYCNLSIAGSSGTGNNPWSQLMKNVFPGLGNAYPKLNNSSDSLITPELQVNLLCLTQKLYRQVSPVTAVGQSLIGFSFADGDTFWHVTFPVWGMWLVGFTLVVLFSIFSFLVAFKIIDIFLRLGFVLVLIPLFVATWVFPATREFTKKGFRFLMSIITEFLGLVLALNFIMVSFEAGIGNNKAALISAMTANYSKKYGENLYNVIISEGGWYFLFMMIALFFIGTTILSVCTKTIASFFGTDKISGLSGDITGAIAVTAIQQSAQKVWKPASNLAKNAKAYEVPDGKSASYLAGRALGRLKSGQNPLKDLGESNSPAASKRYFGQKAGNSVNRASQYLAAGVDKLGVGLGKGLSKTGIGAVVGVPLTLGAKTLSTGIRATGKAASVIMKAPGATVNAIKKAPQALKNTGSAIKNAPRAVWNKVATPFKKGFSDGKK